MQPAIRAPDERVIDENVSNETNTSTEYVPSRQHQVSGTSFGHDPNIQSSTIENLDDDDDEDVYDPNKPTLFQKMQTQTTNQSKEKPTNAASNTTGPQRTQRDEGRFPFEPKLKPSV